MTLRHWTAAALGALVLAGCGGDDEKASTAGNKYPEDSRKAFLDSCDAQPGADRSVCECALSEIEKAVSFEEFAAADKALRDKKDVDPDVQAKLTKATTDCAQKQQ